MKSTTAAAALACAALSQSVTAYEYRYPPSDYVAPYATGAGFESSFEKARNLVSQMTLEEKLNLTVWGNGVPRLGFKGHLGSDGSNGPTTTFTNHSGFTSSITIAASMDRDLMYARARLSGDQLREKGYNVILGPGGNLARTPEGGRNPEAYGADPYINGEGMSIFSRGVQDAKVIAMPKHYIGNEQEHGRTISSTNMDDKTFREVYGWPFDEAVHAGALSIMCAYNLVNGSYSCADEVTLGDVLKGDLGFQGFVLSDYLADRLGEPAFRAGMDAQLGQSQPLYPPGIYQLDGFYLGSNLTAFVNIGSLPMGRVDDAAIRIMMPLYALGQDEIDYPALPNDIVTDNQEAAGHIRAAGAASTVLLKNNGILPLQDNRNLALFGIDAGNNPNGPNNAGDGFQVGPGIFVPIGMSGADINGTLASAWGAGFTLFPYLVSPYDALKNKTAKNNAAFEYVRDPYGFEAIRAAASKPDTVCMAFALSASGEETDTFEGNLGDRNNITAWFNADNIIKAVADNCNQTVVVVHSVGAINMPWADHPNITAIVFAGLPGQESGNSLMDVLYGDYNPSGKLPFTIAYNEEDYSAHVDFEANDYGGKFVDIPYTEGTLIDYRWFDAKNITPRYEFGFGLSYTKFEYSDIKISATKQRRRALETRNNGGLYQSLYTVTVSVKNAGKVAGHATPQLYITFPEEAEQAPRVLRGFEKSSLLKAGDSEELSFVLRKKDVSYWNVVNQAWEIPSGQITAHIGESSRDIRASVTVRH